MIKFTLGILIGASVVAIADDKQHSWIATDTFAILNAGESPTHKTKTIQVDEEGYVICSDIKK